VTEAEWFACGDPQAMLQFLKGKASDRKLRLFAVAVSRLLPVPAYYPAKFRTALARGIQAAEEYADGILDDDQANNILEETLLATTIGGGKHPLIFAVCRSLWPNAAEGAQQIAQTVLPLAGAGGILPDLFGPLPFRPVTMPPAILAWNDETVKRLAESVYSDRAFDRLPILADALEEAGCTDAGMLGHLRGPGPHVRGCWVVDLILGKE
jgi:hypothetical protein